MSLKLTEQNHRSNAIAIELGRKYARLGRPKNTRISLILYVALAIKSDTSLSRIVIGSALIIVTYAAVTAFNDQADVEIDKYNKRELPLAQNALDHSQATIFILVTLGIGGILQLGLLQPYGIIFWIIYLCLGWLYSARPVDVSHRGLLAPLLLSVCYVGLPIYLASSQSLVGRTSQSLLLLFAAIPFSMASLLFKDYKDQKGDLKGGKITPLLMYGDKGVKTIAWVFTLIGGMVLFYLQGYIGLSYFAYLGALVSLFFLSSQDMPQPKLVAFYSYSSILAILCLIFSSHFL